MIKRFLIVALSLMVVFLAGPTAERDLRIKPVQLPDDIDQYLAVSEASLPDIIPGAEKTVVWANPTQTRTPLSIVYLHGYSATRQETAPLSDMLAKRLGANLFYTRLSGHGRDGEALAQASINDWLNDAHEALAIGKRLGERVIVIGTSTGGTLATWLAVQDNSEAVLAYVLISPNFRPYDAMSEMLLWPWGKYIAQLVVGKEYAWTPHNPQHAHYWTHRYPTTALVNMMGLVDLVRDSALESITKPVLVLYSPQDTIVAPAAIEHHYARIGSPTKTIHAIRNSGDPDNHLLAGNTLAPNNTPHITNLILDFVAKLPPKAVMVK